MNARREYRVVEETRGDGSSKFKVEYRNNQNAHWLQLTIRDTLDMAIDSIAKIKRELVVSKTVVYVE